MDSTSAKVGIADTLAGYVAAVDSGDVDAYVSLFAEDGVLVPHGLAECHGQEEIARFIERSKGSRRTSAVPGRLRHHVSPANITLHSDEAASAESYFLATNGWGPEHWGVYYDNLKLVGEVWRFTRRVVVVEGATPDGWIGSGTGVVKFDAYPPNSG
jgi:hypothetical protein